MRTLTFTWHVCVLLAISAWPSRAAIGSVILRDAEYDGAEPYLQRADITCTPCSGYRQVFVNIDDIATRNYVEANLPEGFGVRLNNGLVGEDPEYIHGPTIGWETRDLRPSIIFSAVLFCGAPSMSTVNCSTYPFDESRK